MPPDDPPVCQAHESRLRTVEVVVERIEHAVTSIAGSMQALARLEERHGETRTALTRAFDEIAKMEKRVIDIEVVMPGLKESRAWMIRGILATLGVVGAALLGLVIVTAQRAG